MTIEYHNLHISLFIVYFTQTATQKSGNRDTYVKLAIRCVETN